MTTKLRPTEYVGLVVRSLAQFQNHHMTWPVGTEFVCTYSRAGLHLTSKPCGSCGVCGHVTGVPTYDVEVLRRVMDRPDGNLPRVNKSDAMRRAWP